MQVLCQRIGFLRTGTLITTRGKTTISSVVSAAAVHVGLRRPSSHPIFIPAVKNLQTHTQQRLCSVQEQSSAPMAFNIDWIFPRLKQPSRFWQLLSTIAITAVGLFSKFILEFLNNTRVYNRERLIEVVSKRPRGIPLVTVSNHHSCFDDPGLWGVLPLRHACSQFRIRWSLAAHDICFTNKFHSLFFMSGKCIPVVRGAGVYQPAVDVCIQKLNLGDWVHVFPEGKVNMTKEFIRLKWGVGRMIYESTQIPMILPIWHEGMDGVLPNIPPYILRYGKKVTMNVGKPIDLNAFIEDLKQRCVPEQEARKLITDRIQDELQKLRTETEMLHAK